MKTNPESKSMWLTDLQRCEQGGKHDPQKTDDPIPTWICVKCKGYTRTNPINICNCGHDGNLVSQDCPVHGFLIASTERRWCVLKAGHTGPCKFGTTEVPVSTEYCNTSGMFVPPVTLPEAAKIKVVRFDPDAHGNMKQAEDGGFVFYNRHFAIVEILTAQIKALETADDVSVVLRRQREAAEKQNGVLAKALREIYEWYDGERYDEGRTYISAFEKNRSALPPKEEGLIS
jgi:hypothetical protein